MIKSARILTLFLLGTLAAGTAFSDTAEIDQRVQAATDMLNDLQRIPERAIPPNLLNSAYAVAVIPNVVKGGFFVGGSYGRGLMMVRHPDGSWSNPSLIRLGNLSLGFQFGVQGADLVLVFKNRRGVDNIARGKFTLGGSSSVSAGPVGRTALAMTDGEFKAEIYSYARSRGLFAGVAIDGGAITIDHEDNAAWYGSEEMGASSRIFSDTSLPTPASAKPLLAALTEMAPALNWRDSAAAAPATPPAAAPAAGGQTYPVEDSAPETKF
ncbi:MAG: lipid-binding SYLF domain-containing protein [Gammaproteobacteria bacterium]|nr:lipid-binding SYLF domain-containing protein [Gammaproteobacteria bacterium]